jgi:mycothiol synthase
VTVPDGFTVRPMVAGDESAVAELMNTFDRSFLDEPDVVDSGEITGWWARLELERDTQLYLHGGEKVAGAATVHDRGEDFLDLDAFVHPEWTGRGLGAAMVDWLEEEAERRGQAVARTSALAADERAVKLLAARGFAPIRHFYRMAIDLDAPPPEPEWPAGFEVSRFRPGLDEEVLHAVTEEAFAEHWDHEHRDLDAWQRTVFGTSWWDPSLVYLVREGDEVVAAEVNSVRFGAGWVGTIGTLKPWRGRGLGRALLLTAFGEFYRRGETRVRLGVDAGNETGATQLYESVGMRIAWQADVYEKHL